VAEFAGSTRVRTLAFWFRDRIADNIEWDVIGTSAKARSACGTCTKNFEEIIGQSPALLDALEKVRRVARTDATVIITGETGTGNELIARAMHSASHGHDKPLIKVNCAALPAGLVESELFGHEKGAFSGAISRRVGRFELAHGGRFSWMRSAKFR